MAGEGGGKAFDNGLNFTDTAASRNDAVLQNLLRFDYPRKLARETLAYLNTLPHWPEPYTPETTGDGSDPQQIGLADSDIPASIPAPLEVVEVAGQLRRSAGVDGLTTPARDLAQEGWEALRDHLDDLGPLRPKIGNQMPQLARALDRFATAMGAIYGDVRPVALGTHGARVVAMADRPADTMADQDVAELRSFASAIRLFLERFPAWRAYRDGPVPDRVAEGTVAASLDEVGEITVALIDRAEIAAAIPRTLADLAEATAEDPLDPLVSVGLIRSVGNVLSALARAALPALRRMAAAGRGFARQVREETVKVAVKATAVGAFGLAGVAFEVIFNKAAVLTVLAARFPDTLGWLAPFLAYFAL